MRKLIVVAAVLVLLLLVGGAAWLALSGGGADEVGHRPATTDPTDDGEAARDGGRERVHVAKERAEPASEPEAAPEPEAPVEVISEEDAVGVLTVVEAATGDALPDVDVAFLEFDPENPPDWARAERDRSAFDVAVERGRRLRTGADGTVRVPDFERYAIAAAAHDDIRGDAWLRRDSHDSQEWTLELLPVLVVRARVVDVGGAPAAGVAVAVRAIQDDFKWAMSRADTGDDGIARVEFQRDDDIDDYDVAVVLPISDAAAEPIDVEALPEEPIELALPATGSLRIEVLGPDGSAWTEPAQVSALVGAQAIPEWMEDTRRTVVHVEDGVAVFPRVAVGQPIDVTVETYSEERAPRTETVQGPVDPGAEVVHRIEVGVLRPTVVGRLVYSDGTPVSGLELAAELRVPGSDDVTSWGQDMSATTDGDGGFSFVLPVLPDADAKPALQIGRRVRRGPRSFRTKMLVTRPLPPLRLDAPNDLGSIEIERPDVLVAGRVVGPDGEPLAAGVAVMERSDWGATPLDDTDTVATDDDGSFAVEGTAVVEELHLGVSCDGYYLADAPAFRRGATGVVVRMSRAGAIAGRVRVPEGMETWQIRVFVRGEAAQNNDTEHRWSQRGIRGSVQEDGTFEIGSLRPGTASVSFQVGWNEDDTVLTVEDLRVVGGETLRDPRLQDVEIASRLGGFRVTVLDGARKPVSRATVHARVGDNDGYPDWREFECDVKGVANVLTPGDVTEVVVKAEGYRFASLKGVTTDSVVVLEKSTPTAVTLRLSRETPLPDPPHELRAQLGWAGPLGSTEDGDDWGHDPRIASHGYQDDFAFGTGREVTVQVGTPGRYRVSLWLWEVRISGASGSTVDTVPKVVIVTVPGDGNPVTQEIGGAAEAIRRGTGEEE